MSETTIADLNHHSFQSIRKKFLEYVDSFRAPDRICQSKIILKRNHSLRVSSLSGLISRRLYLNDHAVFLAKIIGLLHDIGRFEQFMRYRTFNDRLSIDHGRFGVELLKGNGLIKGLHPSILEIIHYAITHHNKVILPSRSDHTYLLHAKIIRDADKLDIMHIKLNGQSSKTASLVKIRGEADGISEHVKHALINREIIGYESLKNDLDFHLLMVAWIYDLNFIPSVHLLRHNKFLSKIKKMLPDTDEINAIFMQVENYIDQNFP